MLRKSRGGVAGSDLQNRARDSGETRIPGSSRPHPGPYCRCHRRPAGGSSTSGMQETRRRRRLSRPDRRLPGPLCGRCCVASGANLQNRPSEHGLPASLSPPISRSVGSGKCLDQIIVINESSLPRALKSFFAYYQNSRCHLALDRDSAETREVQPPSRGIVVEIPMVGVCRCARFRESHDEYGRVHRTCVLGGCSARPAESRGHRSRQSRSDRPHPIRGSLLCRLWHPGQLCCARTCEDAADAANHG